MLKFLMLLLFLLLFMLLFWPWLLLLVTSYLVVVNKCLSEALEDLHWVSVDWWWVGGLQSHFHVQPTTVLCCRWGCDNSIVLSTKWHLSLGQLCELKLGHRLHSSPIIPRGDKLLTRTAPVNNCLLKGTILINTSLLTRTSNFDTFCWGLHHYSFSVLPTHLNNNSISCGALAF